MRRQLHPTTAFARSLRRLGKKDRASLAAIRETMERLSEDAFDPRLATHKLKGELAGLWACSAGYDSRIVFEFSKLEDEEILVLVSLGTHDEVY